MADTLGKITGKPQLEPKPSQTKSSPTAWALAWGKWSQSPPKPSPSRGIQAKPSQANHSVSATNWFLFLGQSHDKYSKSSVQSYPLSPEDSTCIPRRSGPKLGPLATTPSFIHDQWFGWSLHSRMRLATLVSVIDQYISDDTSMYVLIYGLLVNKTNHFFSGLVLWHLLVH
jgi:hypothetical protein